MKQNLISFLVLLVKVYFFIKRKYVDTILWKKKVRTCVRFFVKKVYFFHVPILLCILIGSLCRKFHYIEKFKA